MHELVLKHKVDIGNPTFDYLKHANYGCDSMFYTEDMKVYEIDRLQQIKDEVFSVYWNIR